MRSWVNVEGYRIPLIGDTIGMSDMIKVLSIPEKSRAVCNHGISIDIDINIGLGSTMRCHHAKSTQYKVLLSSLP